MSRGEVCEGGRGELEKELVLGTTLRAIVSIGTRIYYIKLLEVQKIKKERVEEDCGRLRGFCSQEVGRSSVF